VCLQGFCNTIDISHGYYSLSIVIVMSDTGMLAHARIALNNTCKFTQ